MSRVSFNTLRSQTLAPRVFDPGSGRPRDVRLRLAASFTRSRKTELRPRVPAVTMAMDERPADLPPEQPDLGSAREAMKQVLRQHHDLGLMGFNRSDVSNNAASMLTFEALGMFSRSREWLRERQKRPREKGRTCYSYWLMHVAGNQIGYTFSGPFIAGAIAEGLPIRREGGRSPNCSITISRLAVA